MAPKKTVMRTLKLVGWHGLLCVAVSSLACGAMPSLACGEQNAIPPFTHKITVTQEGDGVLEVVIHIPLLVGDQLLSSLNLAVFANGELELSAPISYTEPRHTEALDPVYEMHGHATGVLYAVPAMFNRAFLNVAYSLPSQAGSGASLCRTTYTINLRSNRVSGSQ